MGGVRIPNEFCDDKKRCGVRFHPSEGIGNADFVYSIHLPRLNENFQVVRPVKKNAHKAPNEGVW